MEHPDFIGTAQVRLGLEGATRAEVLRATTELLRGDPRVTSWDELWASVGERQVVELVGCGVCIAHGRRGAKELVLAASRLAQPVPGETGAPLRMVFVFGIPTAMAEEYLRAVGALVRACRCTDRLGEILEAATPEDFARQIGEWIG
ncbi:MAG: PTS sugar transporter subunit IIA [Chthoniobacterales bacterium]|nr:PTS sugar transporter subunit IIA [Chthoniobacterales bacterium]